MGKYLLLLETYIYLGNQSDSLLMMQAIEDKLTKLKTNPQDDSFSSIDVNHMGCMDNSQRYYLNFFSHELDQLTLKEKINYFLSTLQRDLTDPDLKEEYLTSLESNHIPDILYYEIQEVKIHKDTRQEEGNILMNHKNIEVGVIEVPKVITVNDIENIVVGAIEGGINYWGRPIGYIKKDAKEVSGIREGKPQEEPLSMWCSAQLMDGSIIVIQDVEDEEEKENLTLDKLLAGIKMNMARRQSLDFDNYDADDYDRIFQYALFEKLVYG